MSKAPAVGIDLGTTFGQFGLLELPKSNVNQKTSTAKSPSKRRRFFLSVVEESPIRRHQATALTINQSQCIDDKYLMPTEAWTSENENLPEAELEQLLGSTIDHEVSSHSEKSSSSGLLTTKEMENSFFIEQNEGTFDTSFFKGAVSARSTSIGSAANFDDFTTKESMIDFGPVATDNLALMNEEEQKFEKDDTIYVQNETFDVDAAANNSKMVNISQYFSQNTSRLGSLEMPNCHFDTSEELRPRLGLEKIASPEKVAPIRVLEETFNVTFSKEEKSDLNAILESCAHKESKDIKEEIKMFLAYNATIMELTISLDDGITSFLEVTQVVAIPDEDKKHSNSRIPVLKKEKSPKFKIPAVPAANAGKIKPLHGGK